jgi:hypothetical protein
MDDLFGRLAPQFGGAFASDSALLAFAGLGLAGGVGLLTQQLSFQYQQNITRLFEVGTNWTYYVAGRAMGSASLSRVLGPRPVVFSFYTVYGNACNAATNTITFSMQQGCVSPTDPQAAATLRFMWLVGCVIQSVGFSAQAEQMMVNEQVQMMYVSLIPQQNVA